MENVGDYGLPIRIMGIRGEQSHFALVGVEDHLLGSAPFGRGTEQRLIEGLVLVVPGHVFYRLSGP